MGPSRRSVMVSLVWGASLARSAVDLNGAQVVAPVTEDDPSPISDSKTYYPDQFDCPLPCADYSNTHSWTPYFSLDRLRRCEEPMLLQFSVSHPLDDPDTTVLIRSCTLRSVSVADSNAGVAATGVRVENPKKSQELLDASLDIAPACAVTGKELQENLSLSASGSGGKGSGGEIARLLEGMQRFFDAEDNCDESFLFAYYRQTVASVYIGPGLGKPTIGSAMKALAARLQTGDSIPSRTVAQLCNRGRQPERVFGVSIDTTGDLAGVQKTVWDWSQGDCAADRELVSAEVLPSIKVFDIAGAPMRDTNETLSGNGTSEASSPSQSQKRSWFPPRRNAIDKRATCKHIKVVAGDGCASLASKCGISGANFTKDNPKKDLCSTLMPGDYVCCSAGDPYTELKPDPPKAGPDGTCATHLIANGDSCAALAKKYGLTVSQIEKFNKGKTWAWTECTAMLAGYNMCLSEGTAPLPPPQQGTECGPLVPGTKPPKDKSISLADLNPCPLKACCSNWGFCGPFAAHCEIHAPKGGGPGSKLPGFQSTCVSNCGNEIKQNSGPPAAFERIGYYESWNLGRDCLWLKAKNANNDLSYTHIHWGFAEIDPNAWKPVIKDPYKQWADFKALEDVKRIVSFGGWAYSTEPATYNIIRQAIIDNREKFATNLAQFVKDEGLDGVDIDWEYPGDKSVSIAAPASYWYLKAFPIDRIAAVIDYIVYMTYDLHGQWDYGNTPVNLTETLTKAGVPNNKVFVGESSYGRSFHMAKDGCWRPLCEFTGSRIQSDAKPGRCTKTAGYISSAEINEIIRRGDGARTFHDGDSNTDIMLYQGDYISYMTPTTKDTRRADFKGLNFAGSIDWAIDLQAFTSDDFNSAPGNGAPGKEGCVVGRDESVNSGDLCAFSCKYDFCPASLCSCRVTGPIEPPPPEVKGMDDIIAWDELDLDLNRLCKFACKHGYCPEAICTHRVVDKDEDGLVFIGDPTKPNYDEESDRSAIEAAKEEGRTTNYGCVGHFPVDKPIPWIRTPPEGDYIVIGRCSCDNWLVNEIMDAVIEAMPIIAQIGCYMLMSSLKFVLDVGLNFATGGAGRALSAGLDMATTAAQMASYLYPEEEDPEGAFSWWLSPCGGTDLVPEDIKRVFGILNQVSDGVSSFTPPKNIPKGSGRKEDGANPIDRSKPKAGTGSGPNGTGGVTKRKKCSIPKNQETRRMGEARNTLRKQRCVADKTQRNDMIITSLAYAAEATPIPVVRNCEARFGQACYHYRSAIEMHKDWETITCHPEAAVTQHRLHGSATRTWTAQHTGAGWLDPAHRIAQKCDKDEYPPAYLLHEQHTAYIQGGIDNSGQAVRWLPASENEPAGRLWKGVCFVPPVKELSDSEFERKFAAAPNKQHAIVSGVTQTYAHVTVGGRPEFSWGSWGHDPNPEPDYGLWVNPCWPAAVAPMDPAFVLLTFDPIYGGQPLPYDYKKPVPP
ncbi:hypothetical protein DL764_009933 [Monosporascus ibericus]|uniref:chitinase n=1 Tax=Monosporascus ibericus TaxID=155417 RepID=A0A4Q4SWI8_9PEZI|nr:hypothetical protein DL764_009933 [Monosporascus ibericus]